MGKVRNEQVERIFVYGTLLEGMPNHDRFCGDSLAIEPAVTTGRLYHLPYGFPAMFDMPDGQVSGEVMTFPDIKQTLEALDRLEGYRPGDDRCHYERITKRVTTLSSGIAMPVWVYVYPAIRLREIQRVGTFIPQGCWRDFMAAKTIPA